MKNFNKTRFGSYGKWDLAINKGMYKNATIIIICLFLGVTILGFLISATSTHVFSPSVPVVSAMMFRTATMNVFSWMSKIFTWSMIIMSGYLFHNMLTKQGRIMELTVPATAQEKYCWHVLINIFGTMALCLICIEVCDAIYALLSLCVIGSDAVMSFWSIIVNPTNLITGMVAGKINFNGMSPEDIDIIKSAIGEFTPLIRITWIVEINRIFFLTGVFALVNSIKYKNNIPVTILILIILVIALIIALIPVMAFAFSHLYETGPEVLVPEIMHNIRNTVYVLFGTEALAGIICWIMSWKNFKKAQLVNSFNK